MIFFMGFGGKEDVSKWFQFFFRDANLILISTSMMGEPAYHQQNMTEKTMGGVPTPSTLPSFLEPKGYLEIMAQQIRMHLALKYHGHLWPTPMQKWGF